MPSASFASKDSRAAAVYHHRGAIWRAGL